jgi:hypothetical protein
MKFDKTGTSAAEQNRLISTINKYLTEKYKIIESTIQITAEGGGEVCHIE